MGIFLLQFFSLIPALPQQWPRVLSQRGRWLSCFSEDKIYPDFLYYVCGNVNDVIVVFWAGNLLLVPYKCHMFFHSHILCLMIFFYIRTNRYGTALWALLCISQYIFCLNFFFLPLSLIIRNYYLVLIKKRVMPYIFSLFSRSVLIS